MLLCAPNIGNYIACTQIKSKACLNKNMLQPGCIYTSSLPFASYRAAAIHPIAQPAMASVLTQYILNNRGYYLLQTLYAKKPKNPV